MTTFTPHCPPVPDTRRANAAQARDFPGEDGDLFVVVGVGPGLRLRITAGSPMAATAAAQLWEHDHHLEPMTVQWSLRDDLPHPRPVLLCTQTPDHVVHATPLVPGKPASAHPETCCGLPLNWETRTVQVCWPEDGPPCPDCLTTLRPTRDSPRSAR